MKFALAAIAALAMCQVHASPLPKVHPELAKALSEGPTDMLILLEASVQTVIKSINQRAFVNSGEKATILAQELRAHTGASQKEILDFLTQNKVAGVKGFWITNRIFVPKASAGLVQVLKSLFGNQIQQMREPKIVHLINPEPESETFEASEPKALEWGVDNIDADVAWENGITGKGIVVSSIDTGVRATHTVLKDTRRATHSWFDASQLASLEPADSQGHGTHTMGTIAGTTGTGVAPGSEWIHCRGFDGAQATEEALLACGQWILCPTESDGTNEDCTKKPQVCSNSWGGGNEDPFYNDVIDSWQASQIIPVFAIGNSGPGCRSAGSPGDQPNLISVGATNAQNHITQFSSHGPSATALRIKPEVSAPGNNVRSASNGGDNFYTYLSGTSMACPHVAGAIALLLEKNPEATFDQVKSALETTAYRPEMPDIICSGGGVNVTDPWPNNSHGWGKINVWQAIGAI